MSRWRVGVDAGGTFTDICLFNEESGAICTWKVSSTPEDPSRGISQAIQEGLSVASRNAADAPEVVYFAHGTTVATNALIEKRGAKTGLLTTDGFRDLLEIGRQRRPSLYDLQADKPEVLVNREMRLEIGERVLFDGQIERSLDIAAVRKVVQKLKEFSPASVVICFLYSFINPKHERVVKQIVSEEMPQVFVTTSHEVAPEFREFERLSTAVLNGYLGPTMSSYLSRLSPRLREIGVRVPPHITQSNGGIISFETAQANPVRTLLSGPSTGVMAALRIGEQTGVSEMITFDMGGTSTDVALIEKGAPTLTSERQVHGYPLKIPMLDIHTVGAGGGSIAYIDTGGHLKVGPRSAGADPGPVCYDRGNTEPTVTDANVVLQTLNPTNLLGGRVKISQAAARAAISRLARELGIGEMEAAQGIIDVVTSNMAKAIRVISVQRGHDLRDFTLVAFGGAGPLFAGRLGREFDMPRILVPPNPGILCAMGLLLTELRTNYSVTRLLLLKEEKLGDVSSAFSELQARAHLWFEADSIADQDRLLKRSIDVRYAGQNYEIGINLPAEVEGLELLAFVKRQFELAHEQLYGYFEPDGLIQLVTFRLEASAIRNRIEFKKHAIDGPDPQRAKIGERGVYFREVGQMLPCPVFDRAALRPGNQIDGPAILEQMDTTTVLLPGQSARVDSYLNLIIEVN